MKHYLLCALLLSACARIHPLAPVPVVAAPVVAPPPAALPVGVDSVRVIPHRSLLDQARAAVGLPAAPAKFGRLGKKSVVNIYYAPATVLGKNATAAVGAGAHLAVAGKRANQATDSATQQVATNAVAGHGNAATQTATTKQAPDWRATLLKPLGYALAIAVLGGGLYLLWPLIARRRLP